MTRVDRLECDVCGREIGHDDHLRLRRWLLGGFYARLYNWGITDYSPVSTGWRKARVDICEECWGNIQTVVAEHVDE